MSEQQQQAPKNVKVNVGEKDGITVSGNIELERYEIIVPNKYDAYWMLGHKEYATEFEPALKEGQKKNWDVKHFFVPLTQLESSSDREQFNIKVAQARKENRERIAELDAFKFGTTQPFQVGVIDIVKNDLSWRDRGDVEIIVKEGVPMAGYIKGEVLAVGKYYTLFNGGDSKDGSKHYIQAIETNRFLKGKEFENREEAINQKFKVGHEMYMSFKGPKSEPPIPTDYQKDLNSGMSKSEAIDAQIARDQLKEKNKQASDDLADKLAQSKEPAPAPKKPSRSKSKAVEQARSI